MMNELVLSLKILSRDTRPGLTSSLTRLLNEEVNLMTHFSLPLSCVWSTLDRLLINLARHDVRESRSRFSSPQ